MTSQDIIRRLLAKDADPASYDAILRWSLKMDVAGGSEWAHFMGLYDVTRFEQGAIPSKELMEKAIAKGIDQLSTDEIRELALNPFALLTLKYQFSWCMRNDWKKIAPAWLIPADELRNQCPEE